MLVALEIRGFLAAMDLVLSPRAQAVGSCALACQTPRHLTAGFLRFLTAGNMG